MSIIVDFDSLVNSINHNINELANLLMKNLLKWFQIAVFGFTLNLFINNYY